MKAQIFSKSTPSSVLFMSVIIGFFADIKCVNAFLVALNPAFEGAIMSMLYVVTIGILFISAFISKTPKALNVKNLWVVVYSLFLYTFTVSFLGQPRVSFLMFIVFSIIAYVIPLITTIDVKITLRSIMFFSVFSLLRLDVIFAFAYDYNEAISMGASYAYLIPVLATIVYSFYYLHEDKGFQKLFSYILIVANFIFFLELFIYGSRGPLLAIICCVLFLYILSKRNSALRINTPRVLVVIVLVMVIIATFMLLLNSIIDLLGSLGINSYSLNKIVRMFEMDNLSNGREDLSRMSIDGFLQHPILGNGLDLFSYNTKVTSYPHNFILQILYDGGLLFFFILMIPAIRNVIKLFKQAYYSRVVFFVFAFCASVPGALFSGDLWELNMLWLFFGFLSNPRFIYK